MTWDTVHAIGWMSVAAMAAWLLIDAFRSGRTIGSRSDNVRVTNPGGFWTTQGITALALLGAVWGLFKTLEGMTI